MLLQQYGMNNKFRYNTIRVLSIAEEEESESQVDYTSIRQK